ncbi:hypothetical protein GCM10028786_11710 [Flaviaesturariibacter terrae]
MPLPGESVSIAAGVDVTLDVNASIAALQINDGSSASVASLTFNPGVSLTVAANTSLGSLSGGGGKLVLNSGSISTTGFAATTSIDNLWDPGTGTVTLTGNNTLPPIFSSFYNLNVTGGAPGDGRATNAGADLSIGNNLTVASSTVLNMVTYRLLSVGGALDLVGTIETQNTSGAPLPSGIDFGDLVAGIGSVLYDAPAGGQSIVGASYNNVYITHSAGGTSNATGNITIRGEIVTQTTGTILDMGLFKLDSHPLGGIGGQNNVGTIRTQYLGDLISDFALPVGRNWGGTIEYYGASGQKIVNGNYTNLTVSGNGTHESSSIDISGALVTSAGSTIDLNQETITGTFDASGHAGNLIVRGTTPFASGKTFGGTVTYDGTVAQTVRTGSYNNLSITTFRSFDLTLEAGTISVAGNLLFSAVLENGASIVDAGALFNFNGTAAQTIDVTARKTGPTVPFEFGSITLSGGGSKTLLTPLTMNGVLNLLIGVLITTNANLLLLNSTATATGGNTTSYVQGPVRRLGADAFVFPLGGGGVYAPLGVSAPGTGGDLTATYVRSNPQAISTTLTPPVVKISGCEYWNLQKAAGALNPSVTLFWSANSGCNGPGAYISDVSSLVPVRFDGAAWVSMGVSGTTGNTTDGSITSNDATAFDNITLGSTSTANLLPVRFISVSAERRGGSVELRWKTAAEFNVARYEVQRSADGRTFSSIGQVTATQVQGGSAQYSYSDRQALVAQGYYRIRAVDQDGRQTLSAVLRVHSGSEDISLDVYPVPVRKNGVLQVRSTGLAADTYDLLVIDATGRVLQRTQLTHSGGALNYSLSLPASLSSGSYQLLLRGSGYQSTKGFTVQ